MLSKDFIETLPVPRFAPGHSEVLSSVAGPMMALLNRNLAFAPRGHVCGEAFGSVTGIRVEATSTKAKVIDASPQPQEVDQHKQQQQQHFRASVLSTNFAFGQSLPKIASYEAMASRRAARAERLARQGDKRLARSCLRPRARLPVRAAAVVPLGQSSLAVQAAPEVRSLSHALTAAAAPRGAMIRKFAAEVPAAAIFRPSEDMN